MSVRQRASKGQRATPRILIKVLQSKLDPGRSQFVVRALDVLVNGNDASEAIPHAQVPLSLRSSLDKEYGQGWNVVIGQDLSVAVRYMVDAFCHLKCGSDTVLVFKCAPESYIAPASLPKEAPPADSRHVAVFRSGMNAACTNGVVSIMDAARSRHPGDVSAFLTDLKSNLTVRFGSTWHVVHGRLDKRFCASLSSDLVPKEDEETEAGPGEGQFDAYEVEARVGKAKVVVWRESDIRTTMPLDNTTKFQYFVYFLALMLAVAWFLVWRHCDYDCLRTAVAENPHGCGGGEDAVEEAEGCSTRAKYFGYAAAGTFLLSPAVRTGRRLMQKLQGKGGGASRRKGARKR